MLFPQDNFSTDAEFKQFLNCINELEDSAKTTSELLTHSVTTCPDTVTRVDSRVNDSDGLFMQIDRLSQSVGELEYEVSVVVSE